MTYEVTFRFTSDHPQNDVKVTADLQPLYFDKGLDVRDVKRIPDGSNEG
jgi:hypothetical protein